MKKHVVVITDNFGDVEVAIGFDDLDAAAWFVAGADTASDLLDSGLEVYTLEEYKKAYPVQRSYPYNKEKIANAQK